VLGTEPTEVPKPDAPTVEGEEKGVAGHGGLALQVCRLQLPDFLSREAGSVRLDLLGHLVGGEGIVLDADPLVFDRLPHHAPEARQLLPRRVRVVVPLL